MTAELEHGVDVSRSGFISIEDLEVLAHLADDRLLALAGAKERLLPGDAFSDMVRVYFLKGQQPSPVGAMGLARAQLMMGIVDGLRDFVRHR